MTYSGILDRSPNLFGAKPKKRKSFSIKTKKNEWMLSAGKNPYTDRFAKTSECRQCGRSLSWGGGTYDFDHRNNNNANNSQRNCYLVCKVCHGSATVIKKKRVKNAFGQTVGYKTIKRKIGYKKAKKRLQRKQRSSKKTAKTFPSLTDILIGKK